MVFRPCLLIPIYNHGQCIRRTVARLARHGLTVFVVDDGSNPDTQQALDALIEEFGEVRLLRRPVNGGKGAAVMDGMRAAHDLGFSHALQIDADGQHDPDDVPRFLELGARHPEALVCGQPIYDESMPLGRRYGRHITHFWVGVELLGAGGADSMCGFRLYPLNATCALIDEVSIPTRMDFDIEILVRLAWRGVPLFNVPTKVIYPDDGVSHFDLLRDNVRISWMHTRLVFGMLWRLPSLLWRKVTSGRMQCAPGARRAHWAALAERGSLLGLLSVFACYRLLGRRAARLLLYPVVGYFFLTGRKARTASLDYLGRIAKIRASDCRPGWAQSFRHMLAFGEAGLDKLAAWADPERLVPVDFPERAEFERLVASKRGAVLIGSHLGNLEMSRALAVSDARVPVNAVVFTDHALRFNSILAKANANFGVNLIQVTHLGPETAIDLKAKIERGELVVIVGDRTPPDERSGHRISCADFLGEPAPFAQGPFILASLLDCPVYLFFCLRDGDRFRLHLEAFAERIDLPRKARAERLEAYIRQYAKRLEHYCLTAPEQWFNFYNFWRKAPAASPERK